MRTYAAVKIVRDRQCKHVELHKITVPDFQDPGFYRSVRSLNAFAHNGNEKKNRGCWSPTHLYVVKRWQEFEEENKRWSARLPELDDTKLPTFEHKSIWAFYLHEGYDYKHQKWLDGGPARHYTRRGVEQSMKAKPNAKKEAAQPKKPAPKACGWNQRQSDPLGRPDF